MSRDDCQVALWGKRALAAARRGDRDACRYLFVRYADVLVADFVEAGVPRDEAEARARSLFSRVAQSDQDPVFGEWLRIEIDRRAIPA